MSRQGTQSGGVTLEAINERLISLAGDVCEIKVDQKSATDSLHSVDVRLATYEEKCKTNSKDIDELKKHSNRWDAFVAIFSVTVATIGTWIGSR